MLCLNPNCRALLSQYQWGEGYCSAACEAECSDGMALRDMMHGDRGSADVAAQLRANADLSDAMHEACAIDPALPRRLFAYHLDQSQMIAYVAAARVDARLPEIIFQRSRRQTYREIGASIGLSESMVRKIVARCARNVLLRCGLRTF